MTVNLEDAVAKMQPVEPSPEAKDKEPSTTIEEWEKAPSFSTPSDLIKRGIIQQNQGAPPFQQKYAGEFISAELLLLQTMQAIQMSPLMIDRIGDAGKAHSVFTGLVINFDALVMGFMESSNSLAVRNFKEEREDIVASWNDNEYKKALELYTAIVNVLTREGVFKIKRYSYFGVGWEKEKAKELEEGLEEAQELEKEDENSGE